MPTETLEPPVKTQAVEQRKFQMHEKLLLDVILRQAGSVQKAVLEGVMNSIEAGASKVEVILKPSSFSIVDDGKGFQSRDEIERFFETFGQPHEASEGKVWAQFRMGRGQMFAFGRNLWRTGRFLMRVDIKSRLGYDLYENDPAYNGCHIGVDLYSQLSDRDLYGIVSEVERFVKYVKIPVLVNGNQVNTPPDSKKWGPESSEDAYIRLNENGSRLEVYNLGVLVCDVNKYTHGVAGTIVSKKRLDVNFARNDVIRSCPVWKAIMKRVENSAPVQRVKSKRVLSEEERLNVIERLCSGEMDVTDLRKTQLFLDVSGHPWSINSIIKANFPCWTFAPAGDQLGDKLIQSHKCLVLDEQVIRAFNCKPENVFTHPWKDVRYDRNNPVSLLSHYERLPFAKYADMVKDVGLNYIVLTEDKWSRNEWMWMRIASELQRRLTLRYGGFRRMMLGSSDAAGAWTDGKSYIVITREFLKRRQLQQMDRPVLSSLTELAILLVHELCHDGDSKTNTHSPEFYKAYHELTKDRLGGALKAVHSALCNGWLATLGKQSLKRQEVGQVNLPEVVTPETEPEMPSVPEAEFVPVPKAVVPPEAPVIKVKVPTAEAQPKTQVKAEKKAGRVASQVTDADTIRRISALYKGNGGSMSYEEIEKVADLNLRQSNGMTAYRIIKGNAGTAA